jgi:Ni,Fe-hydrogenase III large subunit
VTDQLRRGEEEKEREMDLRVYYQKIRDIEAKIAEEFPVVVSKETADGGKTGTKTEVSRNIAARLIVEGLADLAKPEDVAAFRTALVEAKRIADQVSESAKMHLTVLSTADLEDLKGKQRRAKG